LYKKILGIYFSIVHADSLAIAMAEDEQPLAEQPPAIFTSVHFQIIISDQLPETKAEEVSGTPGARWSLLTREISRVLVRCGGIIHTQAAKTATTNLDGLTHIITETIDFEGYNSADDRMIAVVNQSWITTSVTKKRLANPKSHSPDPRMFFSGLVICAAELSEGDIDAIIGGVLAMGGLYSSSISKLVTHVVALDTQPIACQTVAAKGFTCKIVRPEWYV
jgi:hypothetical protein